MGGGSERSDEKPGKHPGRGLSVLVVEDNDYNVDVCKQMLEFLGCAVTVAFDGRQALELLKYKDVRKDWTAGGLPFDLVLMDCDMPVMNGFDATRAIRRWEREGYDDGHGNLDGGPHMKEATPSEDGGRLFPPPQRARMPIIALTAFAMLNDKQMCFDAGMDDYVTKPLMLPVLREKLDVNSERRRTREGDAGVGAAGSAKSSNADGSGLEPGLATDAGSSALDNPLVSLLRQRTAGVREASSSRSRDPGRMQPEEGSSGRTARVRSASTPSTSPGAEGPGEPKQKNGNQEGGSVTLGTEAASPSPATDSVPPPSSPKLERPLLSGASLDPNVPRMDSDDFWKLSADRAAEERAPSDSAAELSTSELLQMFGDNRQLVRMALQRFDVKDFERMREPFERSDFKRIGRLAHSWKGACSYICAKQAQRAAARLEHSAKALADAESSDFLIAEASAALHGFRSEMLAIAPAIPKALKELDASSL